MFDNLDLSKIAVRDNGVLKVENGSITNKKFKYLNNGQDALNIEAITNIQTIINIKTN